MNHKLCMCATVDRASEMPGVWIKLYFVSVCLGHTVVCPYGMAFRPCDDFFDTLFTSGNLFLCNILLPLSALLSPAHASIYLKSLRLSYLGLICIFSHPWKSWILSQFLPGGYQNC